MVALANEPVNTFARKTTISYSQSFCLVVIAVIAFFTIGTVVHLIFVDFVHGNPHRPQSNAVSMMLLFPFLFSVITLVGVTLLFGLSQILQLLVVNAALKGFGWRGRFAGLVALPAIAIISWYCYDYLAPTDFTFMDITPSDWKPGVRYLIILVAQAAFTLFNVLWFEATIVKKFRGHLVVALLLVAVALGGIGGYATALQQNELIDAKVQ